MNDPLPWRRLERGPVVAGGTSRSFLTGGWREQRPILDLERCVHCMLCWLYCPDSSILTSNGRVVGIDLDHCKGCGICAAVCPPEAAAISMQVEAGLENKDRAAVGLTGNDAVALAWRQIDPDVVAV